MNVERTHRAAALFEQALDLMPADRARFLDEHCADDSQLRAAVDLLLRHDASAGSFLEGFPDSPDPINDPSPDEPLPDRIGEYRIIRRLGAGGMGEVYEARHTSLDQPVAVKLVKAGAGSRGVLRRFEYEARLLARLRHPHIAQIFVAGTHQTTAGNVPFFAMEYLPEARSITQFAEDNGLSTQKRLELFAPVCDAVHHGHQKGVIHRDLKPSNILVDASGRPKVIDFGVGCCIDPDAALPTMQTTAGQLVGTVQYMSPEQCAADSGDIDTRSDIYSLGVVLYQLLTNRMPYGASDGSLFETLRAVREASPPRLSAISRRLGGDLDTIVRKALEKDRSRRYQSAAEFSEDLHRYLRHEPITAQPPTLLYQFRRFARRHRTLVGGIAAVFLVLVAGIIATSVQTMRANRARTDAEQRRVDAEHRAYEACIFAADAAIAANDGGAAMQRLGQAPVSVRNWEWRYLSRCADQSEAMFKGLEYHRMAQVSLSPDARFVTAVSLKSDMPSHLHVWDRNTHRMIGDFVSGINSCIPFSYSADGQIQRLTAENQLCRFDPVTEAELDRQSLPRMPVNEIPVLMSATLWVQWRNTANPLQSFGFLKAGATSGRRDYVLDESQWITNGAISADGRRTAVSQNDGTVFVCDTTGDAPPTQLKAPDGETSGLALSRDATRLAVCGQGGAIKVWAIGESAPTGSSGTLSFQPLAAIRGSSQLATCVAFSPDNTLVAVGSADKTVRVWRLADSTLLETFLGHGNMVTSVEFSSDGNTIVSGSQDSTVRLWSVSNRPAAAIRREMPGIISVVAFDRTGTRLSAQVARDRPRVLDAANGQTLFEVSQLPPHERASFSRDGTWVVIHGVDGVIRIVDLPGGRERFTAESGNKEVTPVALCNDESQCAWADGSGTIHLLDTKSGLPAGELHHGGGLVNAIAYSPDGRQLAAGMTSGALTLWSRVDTSVVTLQNHKSDVIGIAYSADRRFLATTSDDETVNLYDATDLHLLRTLHPQMGDVWCAAFSPDSSRLAVGGRDRTVRLFDTASGRELLTLRGPTGTVMSVAYSPDGRRIAAGSWSREVFIWDAGPSDSQIN